MTAYSEALTQWFLKPTTNADVLTIILFCAFLWGLYHTLDIITYLIIEWRINK